MLYFAFGLPPGNILLTITLVTLTSLFFGALIVQWLWNWTMPLVMRLPTITYWQAFRLWLLCSLLFGGILRFNFDMSEHIIPAIYIGQPPYELKK